MMDGVRMMGVSENMGCIICKYWESNAGKIGVCVNIKSNNWNTFVYPTNSCDMWEFGGGVFKEDGGY